MKRTLILLLIIASLMPFLYSRETKEGNSNIKSLKILHLSFHKGCIQEFAGMAKQLDLHVESWFIPDLPGQFFDGVSQGNVLYNITHDRAKRIWHKHERLFQSFDAILVSDTAPLSRIFLQNGWKKPLIVWVCNRFDYCDRASLDDEFPDQEYYELFRKAAHQKNVFIIPYTSFERYYAKNKNVSINNFVIAPCYPEFAKSFNTCIPPSVKKEATFFLPPYHNETQFVDLVKLCESMGIKSYCGRYNGPKDLKDFKGVIHLPYNWSNLAFFENIRYGIPYFVPSQRFLKQLLATGKYFHADMAFLTKDQLFNLSEWYSPLHQDIITYFDSWEDLKYKIETTDFARLRKKVKAYAREHYIRMFDRWQRIFQQIHSLPCTSQETAKLDTPPFVIGRLSGQLGNQFFIIAATMSLAMKHRAIPIFPDLTSQKDANFNFKVNHEHVFQSLNTSQPVEEIEYYYREPEYSYLPIPYHDNMEIRGWFQSEKYFQDHKKEIIELFSPSQEIVDYLRSKYADIIDAPNTVAIHFRSYLQEDPNQKVYVNLGLNYYERAMSFFPQDTVFIVFSQHMKWCKEHFSKMGKHVRFIEGETHFHDLYLMSLCKHNIIGNSTFSWWGAYLNKNPRKKVIAPMNWFCPSYNHDTKDLVPPEWILISS